MRTFTREEVNNQDIERAFARHGAQPTKNHPTWNPPTTHSDNFLIIILLLLVLLDTNDDLKKFLNSLPF